VRTVPRLCEFYPGICLTTEEKTRKNFSQGKKNFSQVKENFSQVKKNLSQVKKNFSQVNPLNAELNPICHLLALLGAHHIFHISRIRVKKNFSQVKDIICLYALL
jgi:hypothetical protein